MQIREFATSDAGTVKVVVELLNACHEVDAPWDHPVTLLSLCDWLDNGWDLEPPRSFVGEEDRDGAGGGDATVAFGTYSTSEWDNQQLAWTGIQVHPERRRRGHGRAMFEHLADIAVAEAKTTIGADGWDAPAARGFAAAMGLAEKSRAVPRRMTLADTDPKRIAELHAAARARATAYELVRIVAPSDDELVDAIAEVTGAINDAPRDDLELDDEVFPAQRIRDYETAQLRNHRLYRVVARHRDTGELAGHTVVGVEVERPQIAYQHDTSVVRSHRGHRLGMLLKADMVRWLAEVEPQIATIDTWNAESNDHMIGVNEELGYRSLGRGLQFQKSLRG